MISILANKYYRLGLAVAFVLIVIALVLLVIGLMNPLSASINIASAVSMAVGLTAIFIFNERPRRTVN